MSEAAMKPKPCHFLHHVSQMSLYVLDHKQILSFFMLCSRWLSGKRSYLTARRSQVRFQDCARTSLCGVCVFLPVSGWVSSRSSSFPHQPITCTIGPSSNQVILTISLPVDLETGPRALSYSDHSSLRIAPVASKDGLNAENKFRCTLYNDQ